MRFPTAYPSERWDLALVSIHNPITLHQPISNEILSINQAESCPSFPLNSSAVA